MSKIFFNDILQKEENINSVISLFYNRALDWVNFVWEQKVPNGLYIYQCSECETYHCGSSTDFRKRMEISANHMFHGNLPKCNNCGNFFGFGLEPYTFIYFLEVYTSGETTGKIFSIRGHSVIREYLSDTTRPRMHQRPDIVKAYYDYWNDTNEWKG